MINWLLIRAIKTSQNKAHNTAHKKANNTAKQTPTESGPYRGENKINKKGGHAGTSGGGGI